MWKTSVKFWIVLLMRFQLEDKKIFTCVTRYTTCINPTISHNTDILVLKISWKNNDTLDNEWNFSQSHPFSWKRMNLSISCLFSHLFLVGFQESWCTETLSSFISSLYNHSHERNTLSEKDSLSNLQPHGTISTIGSQHELNSIKPYTT